MTDSTCTESEALKLQYQANQLNMLGKLDKSPCYVKVHNNVEMLKTARYNISAYIVLTSLSPSQI